MNVGAKFKSLIRDLDPQALQELSRLVSSELSRQTKTAFEIDQIHPRMSPAEKERAAREIAEVLKGRE